jgi:transposase-like protein
MDPQTIFCPNWDCPARGQVGRGNIGIHSRNERRYICHQCRKTFTETKGTPLYRLRSDWPLVTLVLTLLAYGCPLQAIVVAFRLDERTVREWLQRAGRHSQTVHEHLVQQPRDLGQVQADELRVKQQGDMVWLAMAVQVATRLWLGAVVSPQRDMALITALVQQIRRCALCRPVLIGVDGWRAYVGAIQTVFGEAVATGARGRPVLRPWDGIVIAQVVKQYAHGHVMGVVRRIVQGTEAQVNDLLRKTQGGGVINTAYIERLNATFRSRLAGLVRRGRSLLRQTTTLRAGVYWVGTVYNLCTYHQSLRLPLLIGRSGRRRWVPRTPAMAAGLTDHRWMVHELLSYHVPPSRWTPPKRRGRPSQETKLLIEQWCQWPRLNVVLPAYALVAVNQRGRLGPPLGDRADLYLENVVKNRVVPCYVFRFTALLTGIWLVVATGLGLGALVTNWVLGVKLALLLVIIGLLSVVTFSLQPRIDALFAKANGGKIADADAAQIRALRLTRKQLSSLCMFCVLTISMFGVQALGAFPLWLTVAFIVLIAAFTWRMYSSVTPYGWV